jgi:hypothetical protein
MQFGIGFGVLLWFSKTKVKELAKEPSVLCWFFLETRRFFEVSETKQTRPFFDSEKNWNWWSELAGASLILKYLRNWNWWSELAGASLILKY